jgi:NAD(P)-dependent dehydrogenase (short-subunit alcohol dehydrogenase family)
MGEVDAKEWFKCMQINVFGTYNYIRPVSPSWVKLETACLRLLNRASVEQLEKSKGYIVVVSSAAAICRAPGVSSYLVSDFIISFGSYLYFSAFQTYPQSPCGAYSSW